MRSVESVSAAIGVSLRRCTSSNILAYGYKAGDLWILFKGYKLYKYPGITKSQFVELDSFSSKGRWVNKNLVRAKAKCEAFEVK